MTKNIVKILLLLVLAAGSSFMYFFSSKPNDDLEKFNLTRVEYIVKDAKLYGTNTEGEFLYTIVAKKAQANNADRQIYLDQVFLDYDGDQDIDWRITSEKGQLLSNSNVLALSGNVTVQSLSNENNMTTISTDYLEINPNTYTIATNRDVLIELDNNKIEAKGLTAQLKNNRLNFISNINASIQP
jgi:lipopolysaccharide export system protein LptC|tara:strand:- start:1261 stop:1815 length:555 start_codon:yes stop_codon:yes gene_type:complete